ncbi:MULTISPECIES: MFS transporter [unclassified Moraxella]|uniref:MFS transporter n=1 Tax=unclassified Moraxella TaxID=2685852 RepID=UPI003AF4537F
MNSAEKRAIIGLGGIFALRMLGLFMIVPVFSVYGMQYAHTTPFLLGLAVGIYGLGQAIFQIPMSFLADKYPRKPIIIAGLLVFALGGVICALATDIYTVILGRLIAGSGAVSAVVMALLADITREQQRTKAMATMGLTIAMSVMVAFGLGPMLSHIFDISGLFWVTVLSALLAIGLLFIVPTPTRVLTHNLADYSVKQQFIDVLKIGNINRLHLAVFTLHLSMTAMFTLLPHQFSKVLGLTVAQQGYVYLPLLLLGFIIAVPLIIIAEKKRQMRPIFLASLAVLALGLGILAVSSQWAVGLIVGLAVYYIGFNSLEATIPSWISKQAPVANKATAMGLNSSAQFLGAFVGGALGGILLTQSDGMGWAVLAGISVLGLLLILPISSPPYLTSLTLTLPTDVDLADWSKQLLAIEGIEELVMMQKEKIAYLKLDKQKLTENTRQQMSQIIGYPLAI